MCLQKQGEIHPKTTKSTPVVVPFRVLDKSVLAVYWRASSQYALMNPLADSYGSFEW